MAYVKRNKWAQIILFLVFFGVALGTSEVLRAMIISGGTYIGKLSVVLAGTGGVDCQSKTIGDPSSSNHTNIPIFGWGSDAVTIARIYYYTDTGTVDFTLTESNSSGADPGAGGDITAETATSTLTHDTTFTGNTAVAAGNKVLIDITSVTNATWLYLEACPS